MNDDESEDDRTGTDNREVDDTAADADEGSGDDFDNFEAGTEDEDFGDFDEGFQQTSVHDEIPEEPEPPMQPTKTLPQPQVSHVSIIHALIQIKIPVQYLV